MRKTYKPKIIVVIGPTATGKSALAVMLAKKHNGEIISADSRQVYKGLNIGSGKITKSDMAGIPHFMLDVANPKNRFTVAEYQTLALKQIENIIARGKMPIICGGSGFYVEALIEGVVFPDVPPNAKLRKQLEKKPANTLLKMLDSLDPSRARKIDPNNERRLIRAIEIATTLRKVPEFTRVKRNTWDTLWIGLFAEKKLLQDLIHQRLLSRLKDGLVKEVANLHKNGLSWRRMEELGLEYKFVAKLLKKEISESEFLAQLESSIWHFSKRQMTWFKRNKQINWFNIGNKKATRNSISLTTKWLKKT